jgi:hypothetical protein
VGLYPERGVEILTGDVLDIDNFLRRIKDRNPAPVAACAPPTGESPTPRRTGLTSRVRHYELRDQRNTLMRLVEGKNSKGEPAPNLDFVVFFAPRLDEYPLYDRPIPECVYLVDPYNAPGRVPLARSKWVSREAREAAERPPAPAVKKEVVGRGSRRKTITEGQRRF